MTMTCASCGFRNDDANSATMHCPNCGASYVTTPDSMTRPSAPPLHSGPAPAGYAVPPATPFPSGDSASPYAAPFPSAAPPIPMSPLPTPPPRSNRTFILGALAGAVVVALLGGSIVVFAMSRGANSSGPGATVAASPTATPVVSHNAAAALTPYTDPNHQFAINYPTKWQVSASSTTVAGVAANQTIFALQSTKIDVAFTLDVGAFTVTPQTVGATLIGGTFTITGSPTTYVAKRTKITWQEVAGSATLANGGTAAVTFYWTAQGGQTYLVTYVNSSQNAAAGKVPEYMLATLKLGA